MESLNDHSEFDVIDGPTLKTFMAENLVMNYSNIELTRVLIQKKKSYSPMNSSMQNWKHSYSVMGGG